MLITATVLMSGCGLAVTLSTDLVVAAAPPERAGAAAGISETSANLGSSIGIALLGSLATAIYRTRMVTLLPEAVPQQLARDIRSTLGGAVAAGSQSLQALQQDVLAAARQAFIESMQTTALVCAALVLVLAVVITRTLRRAPQAGIAPVDQ